MARSIILINKPFQLRFAFYVCSWLFALSIVYPVIIQNLFEYFMRYAALDPTGPPLTRLQDTRKEVFWLLVALQAIFVFVTFLISIFISHRIAGPLYKLRKHFEMVKNGDIKQDLFFRKRDHFQELAAAYNDMIKRVRGTMDRNQAAISGAIEGVDRAMGQATPEVRRELEHVLTTLKEAKDKSF